MPLETSEDSLAGETIREHDTASSNVLRVCRVPFSKVRTAMTKTDVIVFAGAGASKAVNPDKYPTTVDFFNRLPQIITEERVFQSVVNFLTGSKGTDLLDVEDILWGLGEWIEFERTLTDSNHFPGWLIAQNRIKEVAESKVNWRPNLEVARKLATEAKDTTTLINEKVFEWYGQLPTKEELEKSWLPLLRGLTHQWQQVELFTTNYDLVLEQAIQVADLPVDTGRKIDLQSHLQTHLWDPNKRPKNSRGLLTKLHGSVDWGRIDGRIHVGNPAQQPDHVILQLGFKEGATEAPFDQFHQHFEKCVSESNALVFVGFAFRDEYINRVLKRAASPSARKVIIINPATELPGIPFVRESVTHLKLGLNPESAKKCLLTLGT